MPRTRSQTIRALENLKLCSGSESESQEGDSRSCEGDLEIFRVPDAGDVEEKMEVIVVDPEEVGDWGFSYPKMFSPLPKVDIPLPEKGQVHESPTGLVKVEDEDAVGTVQNQKSTNLEANALMKRLEELHQKRTALMKELKENKAVTMEIRNKLELIQTGFRDKSKQEHSLGPKKIKHRHRHRHRHRRRFVLVGDIDQLYVDAEI